MGACPVQCYCAFRLSLRNLWRVWTLQCCCQHRSFTNIVSSLVSRSTVFLQFTSVEALCTYQSTASFGALTIPSKALLPTLTPTYKRACGYDTKGVMVWEKCQNRLLRTICVSNRTECRVSGRFLDINFKLQRQLKAIT